MGLNNVINESLNAAEQIVSLPFKMARMMLNPENNTGENMSGLMGEAVEAGKTLAVAPVKMMQTYFNDDQMGSDQTTHHVIEVDDQETRVNNQRV